MRAIVNEAREAVTWNLIYGLLKSLHIVSEGLFCSRAYPRGGAARQHPHSRHLKKNRFCRYYDIKTYKWFPVQPNQALKSADG